MTTVTPHNNNTNEFGNIETPRPPTPTASLICERSKCEIGRDLEIDFCFLERERERERERESVCEEIVILKR